MASYRDASKFKFSIFNDIYSTVLQYKGTISFKLSTFWITSKWWDLFMKCFLFIFINIWFSLTL